MTDVYSEDVNVMAHISVKGEEKLVVHLAAPEVANVADTAGAGDCFVGSLAYFVACHEDITLVEQIRRSVWIASQSVRKRGTQSSYLKRNELPSTVFGTEMFSWL
ncbi:unnamed protein product [Heterobilharzia americana]|nr:unnamed protein product [Heterobilharzia americana]